MTQRQIIITEADRDRLHELLTSEFVQVIGPVEYLDDLKAELRRAKIVPPEKAPRTACGCQPRGLDWAAAVRRGEPRRPLTLK